MPRAKRTPFKLPKDCQWDRIPGDNIEGGNTLEICSMPDPIEEAEDAASYFENKQDRE